MVLAGSQHRPGVHRGSTALADAPRGLDLAEPVVFAGLGFCCPSGPSPTHLVQGRQGALEATACDCPALARLGLAERMRDLAARRTRLAEAFETLFEAPGAGIPPAVADLARGIARDERRFHQEVAAFAP